MQYGALPFRVEPDGSLKIMLITTRGRKQWMIPKGWPIRGMTPHESAAREALEEAGLIGQPGAASIGSFEVHKRLRGRKRVRCEVRVFPLRVDHQRASWREKDERTTRWFTLSEARAAVASESLAVILDRARIEALLPLSSAGGRTRGTWWRSFKRTGIP
ncbi:MAG: NUDIX hydrolase [Microvirga sp.]